MCTDTLVKHVVEVSSKAIELITVSFNRRDLLLDLGVRLLVGVRGLLDKLQFFMLELGDLGLKSRVHLLGFLCRSSQLIEFSLFGFELLSYCDLLLLSLLQLLFVRALSVGDVLLSILQGFIVLLDLLLDELVLILVVTKLLGELISLLK